MTLYELLDTGLILANIYIVLMYDDLEIIIPCVLYVCFIHIFIKIVPVFSLIPQNIS